MLSYGNISYIVDIEELFSKLKLLDCHCETDADLMKFRHETEQLLDSGALKIIDWMRIERIERKKQNPPDPKAGHFYEWFTNKRRRQ